jgi:hypothetical protein
VPKIKYRDPLGQDASIEISESFPEITIGRNPGNVICVNNPSLSRAHARIVFEGGVCTFYDLNSSNGSFVNGKEIRSQTLKPGDRLRCGEFPLEYAEDSASLIGARPLPPESYDPPAPTPAPHKALAPTPPPMAPASSPPAVTARPSHAMTARPATSPPDAGRTWQPDQIDEFDRLRRQIDERDRTLELARMEHERLARQSEDLQRQLRDAQQAAAASPPQDPLADIIRSLHQINAHLGEVCHRLEAYTRDR